jgi:DNA polymerase-3 subunit beta
MIVSANDRTTSVHMRVTNGTMQLTSESMNGNARDEIGVEYSGSELIVGFSARYMLDALCVLNEPQVRIGLDGSLDPIKITPVSAREFTAVIMPVRLS